MNFSPTEYSMDFSKFRSTRIAYSRLYFRPYSGFAMRKSAGINWFSKHSPSKRNNLSSPCKASVIYDYEIMQMLYSRPYIRLKARRNPGTDSCIAVDSYQGNGNAFRRGGPVGWSIFAITPGTGSILNTTPPHCDVVNSGAFVATTSVIFRCRRPFLFPNLLPQYAQ